MNYEFSANDNEFDQVDNIRISNFIQLELFSRGQIIINGKLKRARIKMPPGQVYLKNNRILRNLTPKFKRNSTFNVKKETTITLTPRQAVFWLLEIDNILDNIQIITGEHISKDLREKIKNILRSMTKEVC